MSSSRAPDANAPVSEQTPLLGSASSNGIARPTSYTNGPRTEDSSSSPALYGVRSHPADGIGLAPGAEEAVLSEPEPETEDCKRSDSPFLGGVSVTRFWLIFGGILLQYFVACFDSTLMASSHPIITSYFKSSNSASWLSTAFLLTSTAFQPLLARVSDTIGRRPIYLFSLVMFVLTTAWCALAQSIGSFIAARAFCGLGAGGVFAMGSILTNDLVPIEIRGNYQAYINLFFGLGQAFGAAFGGFLCDTLGWRWTFGIQIPLQLLVLAAAAIFMPNTLGPNLARQSDKSALQHIKTFDLLGSFLLTSTTASMILGLNLGGNVLSWTHPLVITSLCVSVVAGFLLIRVERRAVRPVMPLAMLFTAPRGNLVFNNFFATIGSNTVIFNAPLYFQAVMLDSASQSGFRMAAPSLAVMICGVSSGLIMTYTRRMKELIVGGSLISLAGAICLTSMWDGIPKWLATIFVVPVSTGLGLSFPAVSLAVLANSTQEDQAVMTSTLSLFRSLGAVFGVAISSLIAQNALTTGLENYVTGPEKQEVRLGRGRLITKSAQHRTEGKRTPLPNRLRELLSLLISAHHTLSFSPSIVTNATAVIHAYEHSLRYVFASAIVIFVIVSALVIPIRLPRLGDKKR
ncbi:major facilitator superfamily domain-containing protein [Macrophomina phaseolina]|uniref:Major facilitator superfamily domain-containing protein n=1 Tax=Macrophomina phaseolina TaxID=35725 RepID=A0ABQ8G2V9_9PEZI|nr:major facilitator superfamily domain-containing protein [Macrophomina phaseolina]